MDKESGFSLIEVAIALAILSIGLSGMASLLIRTASGTGFNAQASAATWLADEVAAQLAMTPGASELFLPEGGIAPDCPIGLPCSTKDFASQNLEQWGLSVRATLPGGFGLVCRDSTAEDGAIGNAACDGSGPLVAKLFWQPPPGVPEETARHIRRLEP